MTVATRRQVMAGVGFAAMARPAITPDVVIIGAGLAGLFAGLALEAGGASVLVLEAQDRPGGRLRHETGGGLSLDVGAIQVGGLYSRIRAMSARMGLEVRPQSKGFGKIDLHINQSLVRATDWESHAANKTIGSERKIPPYLLETKLFSARSPLEYVDQWRDPRFASFDVSPAALMRSHGVSDEAVRLIDVWMNAPSVSQSSALHMFREGARPTGVSVAQERAALPTGEIEGGLSRLTTAMAAALKTPLRLNCEVVAVHQNKTGCEVRLSGGSRLYAKHVICAAPLHAVRAIRFDPPLPGLQARAVQTAVYSPITHVHLRPTSKFWEEDGFAPSIYTDGPLERLLAVEGDSGVERMIAWTNGAGAWAADALSPADLMTYTIAEIARIRPASKGKLEPGFVYSWGRNRFAGGIRHVLNAGDVAKFGAVLGADHGRIVFAGEHVRQGEHGMEAAAETGERAAARILQQKPR